MKIYGRPTDDLEWKLGRQAVILGVRMPGWPVNLHAADNWSWKGCLPLSIPQNIIHVHIHIILFPSLFTGQILDITGFNLRPLLNEAESTFFGGYKSSTDIDATITLGRAVDTGTGPDWPPFPLDSTEEPAALGGKANRIMLPASVGLPRVGAFYIDAEKGSVSHRMVTITMALNGKLLFLENLKNGANVGIIMWIAFKVVAVLLLSSFKVVYKQWPICE